ncbi:MAG: dihydroxy-acid dehydratase, partial [Nitrospirota bacterium]|nr:dihydroxy-acid dehydratase [Nitrospirota bacterium]
AALQNRDIIHMDITNRRLDVELSDQEIQSRLSKWTPPKPHYTSGVMAKYAKLVSSASQGAVTS